MRTYDRDMYRELHVRITIRQCDGRFRARGNDFPGNPFQTARRNELRNEVRMPPISG